MDGLLSDHVGADRDELTGLPSRRGLMEEIARAMAAGSARGPALLLLDLDRFKAANDGLGPDIGDVLLTRVAQRLSSVARQARLIARTSGDGFGILIDDARDALALAARLLEFTSRPYAVQGHTVALTASVGIAIAPEDGTDPAGLLHAADLALHRAEDDGRNRIRRFEPSMQMRAYQRQSLEADLRAAMALQHTELRRALVSEQFEVHYQPQISLADRTLTGFEALLRWRHPMRGLVSPDAFIPIAEEIGLIDLIGDWVLRMACRDAARWDMPLRIAVNVSPRQLRDGPVLMAAIARAAMEACLPLQRLELEITETALALDVRDTLAEIRSLGCELALDDFGTGYSSLSRLRDHPFDRIKIDRSFFADLAPEAPPAAREAAMWMVRAIASLGGGLGLGTVAEGIETEAQAALAAEAGCTELQGFLISRALPRDAVPDFINRYATTSAKD